MMRPIIYSLPLPHHPLLAVVQVSDRMRHAEDQVPSRHNECYGVWMWGEFMAAWLLGDGIYLLSPIPP